MNNTWVPLLRDFFYRLFLFLPLKVNQLAFRKYFSSLIFTLIPIISIGQTTAVPSEKKAVNGGIEPWQPNPKKAGLYSAILPGSGQLYNKQYWKIPVVYAGVGAAIYFIDFNSQKYRTYRKAYIARIDADPNTRDEFEGLYTASALKQLQDGYKRYLDMTVLLTAVGYTLQVMDAVVFAHLKNFDVTKDITIQVQPIANQNGIGMGLVINFK